VKIAADISEKIKDSPVAVKAACIYGSFARKTQKRDSDIDLLIIADDIHPKKHRRGKEIADIKEWLSVDAPLDILLLSTDECISNFRNHNPLFLDIAWEGVILLDKDNFLKCLIEETRAYITKRKIIKHDDGWSYPDASGDRRLFMLSGISNRDFAMVMFNDAERELQVGTNILKDCYYDKAVYHFQQSLEKSVKSVLICFGVFRKTHYVGEILLKEIEKRQVDREWKEKLRIVARASSEIEPEVTLSRYPGIDNGKLWNPADQYTKENANETKDICEKSIIIVSEFLETWF